MNILLAMYVCTPCVYLVPEIRGRHGTLGTELPKASGGPLQMFFMVLFCFVLVTASHYVTEIHPPLPLCLSLCLLSAGVKVVQHINALNWGGVFLLPQVLYVEQFGLEFVLLLLPL